MPTAGTGQLAGPLDTLAEMFAASTTFAADVVASGEATAADRVYSIARTDDEEATIQGTGHPFVVLYEPTGASSDNVLGEFGPVELEGRIEYLIAEGDSEREAYVKFANKLDAILNELRAIANGGGGTLVNFKFTWEGRAERTDPLREGGPAEQFYSHAFKATCGLEG